MVMNGNDFETRQSTNDAINKSTGSSGIGICDGKYS